MRLVWKPKGCHNGADCSHCHLCPVGALKARKKVRAGASRQEGHDDHGDGRPGSAGAFGKPTLTAWASENGRSWADAAEEEVAFERSKNPPCSPPCFADDLEMMKPEAVDVLQQNPENVRQEGFSRRANAAASADAAWEHLAHAAADTAAPSDKVGSSKLDYRGPAFMLCQRYPLDEYAYAVLWRAAPSVQEEVHKEFKPQREGDEDYSALVTTFVKKIVRKADRQLRQRCHACPMGELQERWRAKRTNIASGTEPLPLQQCGGKQVCVI